MLAILFDIPLHFVRSYSYRSFVFFIMTCGNSCCGAITASARSNSDTQQVAGEADTNTDGLIVQELQSLNETNSTLDAVTGRCSTSEDDGLNIEQVTNS
jgi:hypothetical protein